MRLAPHYVVNTLVQMIRSKTLRLAVCKRCFKVYQQLPKPDLTKLPRKEYWHLKFSMPLDLQFVDRSISGPSRKHFGRNAKPTPNYYRINTLKIKPEEAVRLLQKTKSIFKLKMIVLLPRPVY